jgi:asparagine synthase (glutamine-hydrolysing)
MCGIAGIIESDHQPVGTSELSYLAGKLTHRGPDDEGIWQKGSVGLAHRRLSIIDLSPLGKQPMISASGRFVIVFNGEIYNYKELKTELEKSGVTFRSGSDTEVLLQLFERKGKDMLRDLRGMFAFAIWDQEKKSLFFARDPLGQKPFYYRVKNGRFIFASEIKALKQKEDAVDWDVVRQYFGLQYVPSPKTGFKEIHALPRGRCGTFSNGEIEISAYVDFPRAPKHEFSFEDAGKEVRRLLEQSVKYRLVADVPVGIFLSGGIDSASIAYLAKRHADKEIKTFTMGFSSEAFDEREQARAIAKDIGSTHVEFECTADQLLDSCDRVISQYDAPYADSSALPTFFLACEASAHVKTVMTGDGGDELFCGYRRYRHFRQALGVKKTGMLLPSAHAAHAAGSALHDPRYDRFAATLEGLRRSDARGYAELFTGSYFHTDAEKLLFTDEFLEKTKEFSAAQYIESAFDESLGFEGAMDFDLKSYLPDDLNVKMDRATMAHGLEARSPFQDRELVEFVSKMPAEYLFRTKQQKPLLREAMKGLVPAHIFEKPKRGFQVPLAEWFRGPLRSTFEERCLSVDSPLLDICRRSRVLHYVSRNDAGEDHGNRLWMLFSLATWMKSL